jgi:hypothetical protein
MAIFSALFDRVIAVTDDQMAPSTYGLHVKGEQKRKSAARAGSSYRKAQAKKRVGRRRAS